MRRRARRPRVRTELAALQDRYVRVAGEIATAEVERHADHRKIDHVWITVRAGEWGDVQVSLSTCSRQNLALHLDPRVRVGSIVSEWVELPAPGIAEVSPLDYGTIEAAQPVEYTPHARAGVEEMLVIRARRAVFVEAWGECYVRSHPGVHQIHSRRASFGVTRDIVGRDGAVQFYYREPAKREMLLFKFAGQP